MNNSFFVMKPIMSGENFQANIKINVGEYEISIACDNSCGANSEHTLRHSMMVFWGDVNVTEKFCGCDEVLGVSFNQIVSVYMKLLDLE